MNLQNLLSHYQLRRCFSISVHTLVVVNLNHLVGPEKPASHNPPYRSRLLGISVIIFPVRSLDPRILACQGVLLHLLY
jgi:hypothetical protein